MSAAASLIGRASASFPGELSLDDARPQGGPERDDLVVEVVARIVDLAAAFAAAVADIDEGPRHLLQHVGEVLRCHDEGALPVHVLLATISAATSAMNFTAS